MLAAGDGFGGGSAATPERVQVEMVSANPTGPVTVASARNGAYGDSVARLLAFAGHDVEREYYYNDAGAQMDKFRASVDAVRRGEDPPEDGYRGDYVAALAQEEGDPVPRMLAQIEAALERFRIHFDTFERQSVVETRDPARRSRCSTHSRRTARCGRARRRTATRRIACSSAPTARRRTSPPMRPTCGASTQRASTGSSTCSAPTITGMSRRLQALAEMLGHPRDSLEVLVYQLVHLTRGGEATKMSKRRGDVVFLDEFVDEIGIDAARWYLVSRGHDQTIEIDIDLAAEKTQKNPVYYVQYAHARIAGILRNADARCGAEPRCRTDRPARGRGARPRQAARRVPGRRRRGYRAPGAARDPDLRDPGRRRLPPLLPPPQGARVARGALPPRALLGDEERRRALPRPDRGRGARPHVSA